ncbi:MAG: hypothetical protein ACE5JP_08865 [Candidatus Bipolaricaulia bacterium]
METKILRVAIETELPSYSGSSFLEADRLHPDHNPENLEAEAHMAALTRAYRLLTAYAESQALTNADVHCDFSQEVPVQAK